MSDPRVMLDGAPDAILVIWVCPVCEAWTTSDQAGLRPPGGPAICEHPSSNYLAERTGRDVHEVSRALTRLGERVVNAAALDQGERERP